MQLIKLGMIPCDVIYKRYEFEWEVFSLSRNKAFMDYLAQARQRGKREGTISIEIVRERLGISK